MQPLTQAQVKLSDAIADLAREYADACDPTKEDAAPFDDGDLQGCAEAIAREYLK